MGAGLSVERGQGVLICIPTYNEAENIGALVEQILGQFVEAHVVVVDDASPDGTGAILDAIARDQPRLHVIHRAAREGLARAYLAAFEWALRKPFEFIFECDADFSHDPDHLSDLIQALRHEADVVVGSRKVEGGGTARWPTSRRLLSWGGSLYAKTILQSPIHDLTGGFNGFRREVLQTILTDDISSRGYAFQIELKYRSQLAGFRIRELPIVFGDRLRGESKMGGSDIGEALFGVIQMRLRLPRASRK
jgi:dolichol-phosphate mannosyltransferase